MILKKVSMASSSQNPHFIASLHFNVSIRTHGIFVFLLSHKVGGSVKKCS